MTREHIAQIENFRATVKERFLVVRVAKDTKMYLTGDLHEYFAGRPWTSNKSNASRFTIKDAKVFVEEFEWYDNFDHGYQVSYKIEEILG